VLTLTLSARDERCDRVPIAARPFPIVTAITAVVAVMRCDRRRARRFEPPARRSLWPPPCCRTLSMTRRDARGSALRAFALPVPTTAPVAATPPAHLSIARRRRATFASSVLRPPIALLASAFLRRAASNSVCDKRLLVRRLTHFVEQ
jgi:hypothetical protein